MAVVIVLVGSATATNVSGSLISILVVMVVGLLLEVGTAPGLKLGNTVVAHAPLWVCSLVC